MVDSLQTRDVVAAMHILIFVEEYIVVNRKFFSTFRTAYHFSSHFPSRRIRAQSGPFSVPVGTDVPGSSKSVLAN